MIASLLARSLFLRLSNVLYSRRARELQFRKDTRRVILWNVKIACVIETR